MSVMSANSVSTNWVKPLLKSMGLVGSTDAAEHFLNLRMEIEKSGLVKNVTEITSQINSEANNRILDVHEFLPPARSIARVSFSKNRVDYILEIVVRLAGPKVVFYTSRKARVGFQVFFGGDPVAASCKVELSLPIRPELVTAGDLQLWFVYLLSSFKEKFKPVSRIVPA